MKRFAPGVAIGRPLRVSFWTQPSAFVNRIEKPSCTNCKYYSNDDLLPCAVHPLGLRGNCPDWELSTEDL
ncbi:hypothetical protein [Scytonema sp. PCC 10023]|uniref:hypothetical protein n=1 Tax=Scytonema sp. PCC 10023 TaxID=1680591 RepID=UPI0039C65032